MVRTHTEATETTNLEEPTRASGETIKLATKKQNKLKGQSNEAIAAERMRTWPEEIEQMVSISRQLLLATQSHYTNLTDCVCSHRISPLSSSEIASPSSLRSSLVMDPLRHRHRYDLAVDRLC